MQALGVGVYEAVKLHPRAVKISETYIPNPDNFEAYKKLINVSYKCMRLWSREYSNIKLPIRPVLVQHDEHRCYYSGGKKCSLQ